MSSAALFTSPPTSYCPSSANSSLPHSSPMLPHHLPPPSQPRVIYPMRQHQHASPLRRKHLRSHPHQCLRLICRGICWREDTTLAMVVYATQYILLPAGTAAAALRSIIYPPRFTFIFITMIEVQLKRFDWGSRIEVGVQGSSPGVTMSSHRFAALSPSAPFT